MDEFGLPGLVQDPDRPEQVNPVKHIRYCFLTASMSQEICDLCGETSLYKFGTRTHSYRDLPKLQDRTVLVIRRQRFKCRNPGCGRTFVQRLPGLDMRRSMTTRCLEWIRANCLYFTFQQIADQIGCNLRTVRDIAYERIKELNMGYRPYIPRWLGIDETSLDGNIDDSCCVLVDLDLRRPIDMLPDCLKETVCRWLQAFGDSPQLHGVAMDMHEAYRTSVREIFPNAQIVADRFHIERWANRAVDRVRINTGKRLKKHLPAEWNPEEWKQNSRLLRKHRHQIPDENDPAKKGMSKLLRKRLRIRNYKPQYDFFKWLALQPDIKTAYDLKEQFCDIYKLKRRYSAKRALERWEKGVPDSMRSPFKTVLLAITDWRNEFLAYFPSGTTNGYTEAFNSVVKSVNRSGNGYSFQVLRARLLFGRKPKLKTVRLKVPNPESLSRDSQPPFEICIYCGQSDRTSGVTVEEAALLYATMPRFVTANMNCPLCKRVVNWEEIKNLPLPTPATQELLKEFHEDMEAGDIESASRFSGNVCAQCRKPFDADKLHPSGFNLIEESFRGECLLFCANCLEELSNQWQKSLNQWRTELSSSASNGESNTALDSDGAESISRPEVPSRSSTERVVNCLPPVTSSTPAFEVRLPLDETVGANATKDAPRRPVLARDLTRGYPRLHDDPPAQLKFAFLAEPD